MRTSCTARTLTEPLHHRSVAPTQLVKRLLLGPEGNFSNAVTMRTSHTSREDARLSETSTHVLTAFPNKILSCGFILWLVFKSHFDRIISNTFYFSLKWNWIFFFHFKKEKQQRICCVKSEEQQACQNHCTSDKLLHSQLSFFFSELLVTHTPLPLHAVS